MMALQGKQWLQLEQLLRLKDSRDVQLALGLLDSLIVAELVEPRQALQSLATTLQTQPAQYTSANGFTTNCQLTASHRSAGLCQQLMAWSVAFRSQVTLDPQHPLATILSNKTLALLVLEVIPRSGADVLPVVCAS